MAGVATPDLCTRTHHALKHECAKYRSILKTRNAHPESVNRSGKQKITLLVLGALALGAVFLLPGFVTEPWIGGDMGENSATADSSPSSVRPSTVAEKTRYRQDSQTVLAQIIAVRDRLENQNVELWAEIEFRQGLEKIETGDQQYSYGDYKASLASFEQALKQFSGLEDVGRQKLAAALTAGLDALESLNIHVATTSSELATAISADDKMVRQLAERLHVLPQLATQLETGDRARAADELGTAEIAYQGAVELDPLHQRAVESLSSIKRQITQSKFNGHMSRGYAALDNNDFELARSAFESADGVYPGHADVTKALAQVENRNSQLFVNQQIAHAAELENQEEWQQALSVYESLLEQDPSLTQAKVKLIPARVRADLDQRLNKIIDDPLTVSNATAYRKAQGTLNDALGIADPGDTLLAQITRLENVLTTALSSVDVLFQSDNLTNVTLFRVAELGRFEQRSVKLRPGRYIAGGTRAGFRDVRIEFTVSGERGVEPVVVRCIESI